MKIDWSALGLVAGTTLVAAVVVVGIMSLGIASLTTADTRVAAGRPAGATKSGGYLCVGLAAAIVLYGLYLIIPQFH